MRLLIVEDDQDGREMLTELFRLHDWEVTPVPTTKEAMVELRAGGFDVVISDENLFGSSGSAMLREASEEGLLHDVGALMYTAEPGELELPPGVRVLQKPLGITRLLDEVAAVARAEAEAPSSSKRAPVQLVLYVTDSPESRRALRTMQGVLDDLKAPRVRVLIHNLDHDHDAPAEGEARVAAPRLVQCCPGETEDHELLADLESTRSVAALLTELQSAAPSRSSRAR